MSYQLIEEELNRVAQSKDIIACALVAVETGMIYLSSSRKDEFEIIAEGARDYWVLHLKNGHIFNAMGIVKSIYVRHAKGMISIQSCGPTMLLITLARLQKTNWSDWPTTITKLRELVAELELLP